ncbi:MAG: glycoside hydrolase [Planctomycetes bacterium]|nr:glycoside hydrolase [Planctomycetota bacterium]
MRNPLAFLLIAAAATPSLAQQAREPQLIVTGTLGAPDGISLASENEDLAALLFRDNGDNTLWLQTSDGRGLNWNAPVRLDDDSNNAPKSTGSRSLTVDGMRIYVAWLDERNGANDDVYFTASLDGGLTFNTNNIRLDDGASPGERDVKDFRIASSGNDIAVLMSVEYVSEELYLTWSNDGGASWEDAVPVTNHNGTADIDDIALAASADRAYIAWRDNFTNSMNDSVWFSSFDLKTESFIAQDIPISSNMQALGGDADNEVEIAVDDTHIAILFHADSLGSSAEQVRVNLSNDLGSSWIGDQKVGEYDNASAGHDADEGAVLVEDGYVAIAWYDDRTSADQIYAAVADVATGIFSSDHLCSDGIGGVGPPQISGEFGDETLAVTWNQLPGRSAKACSYRNGSWGQNFVISNNSGDVRNVRMAWSDIYDNFLVAYVSDDTLEDEIYVGGFRNQQVSGSLTAGSLATLTVSGFESGVDFRVVASSSLGNLLIPDGRNLGVAYDNILDTTRRTSALSGTTDTAGAGSTTPVLVPPRFSQNRLFLLAASFKNSGEIADLSDVVSVLVN